MATVNASSSGTLTATGYGVSVDSSGNVDLSNMVNKAMNAIDIHAPKFVSAAIAAATEGAVTEAAITTAIGAAASALPAELGATVAAAGPMAPFAAIVFVGVEVLLSVWGASGGTGCCGTAPYTRDEAIQTLRLKWGVQHALSGGYEKMGGYSPPEADIRNLLLYSGKDADAPPCNPAEYTWTSMHGTYSRPTTPPEVFISSFIEAIWNQSAGCWSTMGPGEFASALALAVGTWNRTHSPQRTFMGPGGKPVTVGPTRFIYSVGVNDENDPMTTAVREMMTSPKTGKFIVPTHTTVTIEVNEGPVVAPVNQAAASALATLGAKLNAIGVKKLLPIKMVTPAPAAHTLLRLSPPEASVTKVTAPVPWSSRKVDWLGGATPKQAGIFGGLLGGGAWLWKKLHS